MLRLIGRHWRGDTTFWLGVLVYSIALPVFLFWGGIYVLAKYGSDARPLSRIAMVVLVFLLIGAVGVWQLVGTWRASSSSKASGRWWVNRWLARFAAVGICGVAFLFLNSLPRGLAQLYAAATDTDDIGLQGYTVTVEDNRIVVKGSMAWGLLDSFSKSLRENQDIQTVVLNSPGGHVSVGRRLAAMIKKSGLDTLTTEQCSSACTFAFAAGRRRFLMNGARLGFHSEAYVQSDGSSPIALNASQQRAKDYWHESGVPEDFVARVFSTPAKEMWFPTYDELLRATIVTNIVN